MRRTAEAVIKTLFVVDREAGRLFVMERTTRLILAPRAGDLHRPPDQRRQGDARPQLVQPLRGEGHQPPSRLREGLGEGLSARTRSLSVTLPSIRSTTSLFPNQITPYPPASKHAP